MSACTDWRDHYKDAQNSDDNDPFPKMLDGEDDSILGPYVATEIATVENVRALIHPSNWVDFHRTACPQANMQEGFSKDALTSSPAHRA